MANETELKNIHRVFLKKQITAVRESMDLEVPVFIDSVHINTEKNMYHFAYLITANVVLHRPRGSYHTLNGEPIPELSRVYLHDFHEAVHFRITQMLENYLGINVRFAVEILNLNDKGKRIRESERMKFFY